MSQPLAALSESDLYLENQELRARLQEAEETLTAIRSGAVDAVVISGDSGEQVFTLKGADHPYRVLIEEMSESGLTVTEEGVILYANKRFSAMLQTPLEKVIGSFLRSWVPPAMQPVLQTLLEPNDSLRREVDLDLLTSSGNPVATHCSLTTLKSKDAPGYYCMVITDLSEHNHLEELRQAEMQARARFAESERSRRALLSLLEDETSARDRLAASESELRALFAAMRDVVMVLDGDGRVCKIAPTNPPYKRSDELLGKFLADVFPHEEAENNLQAIRQVLVTGQKTQIDYCLPVAGQMLCFEASLSPTPDERVLWVAHDITDRMQAAAALQESEAHFRLLFEDNPAVMLVIEPDSGAIRNANKAAAEFYGYSVAELNTLNIAAINQLPPDQVHTERLRAVREERSYFVFPHRLASGETRTVEVRSAPFKLDGETLLFSIVHDITERVEAEAEIVSLARFPGENPSPVMRISKEGKLLYANECSQPLLDFWQIEVPASVPHDVQANICKALETRSSHEIELDCFGQVFTVKFVPIMQSDYVNVYGTDITQRRQGEKQIRYQAGLLEEVSDAIIATDMTSTITSWNSAAAALYGWPAEEVLGKPVNSLLQTTYLDGKSQEQVLEQFISESVWRGEVTQMCKDGSRVTILASVSAIRDDTGARTGMVAVNRDMTARKQAEANVERQVRFLSALHRLDTAIGSRFELHHILEVALLEVQAHLGVDACAVLLLDPTSHSLENAASRGLPVEMLQTKWLTTGPGDADQAAAKRKLVHIRKPVITGSPGTAPPLEYTNFVDYYAAPLIASGEVNGVLEIFHCSELDADPQWLEFLQTLAGQIAIAVDSAHMFQSLQRSKAELENRVAERTAELIKTNRELEHANQTKDEFLANMSHELRTPLTSILGLSESLMEQRRGLLNDPQLRSLELIESSGRHLLELINDILDVSKIEAGMFDYYPERISIDEICRSSLAFIKSQASKKSISLHYLNEATISRIYADPRRLKQILVNLLTNAVKFTHPHGNVTLQVVYKPDQELIRFSVIDTGIGISAQNLKRLFQPFVQLDSGLNREQDGTGLGLALVQRLTDLHGGSVEVESEVDRGSRFTINLSVQHSELDELKVLEPLMPNPEMAGPQTPQSEAAPIEKPGVILLAEDNMANVLTIGEYLQSSGYEIVVAHDGMEAIDLAKKLHPQLILMDIQMPVLDGLQATKRLRSNPDFATVPIIALTALAMPGDKERCLAAGASYYMSKPVSLRLLVKTVNELLTDQE